MNRACRSRFLITASLAGLVGVGLSTSAGAAESCSLHRWSGTGVKLVAGVTTRIDTGIIVQAGQVRSATYISGDGYIGRRLVRQDAEQWTLAIGGVAVGSLTKDVPDPTDVDEAGVAGELGPFSTTGGAVSILHGSLVQPSSGPQSVRPISLIIEICEPQATTTTAGPATTVRASSISVAVLPTTLVPTTIVPTTTVGTSPATVLGRLPETGSSDSRSLAAFGFIFLGIGVLLTVKRRPL